MTLTWKRDRPGRQVTTCGRYAVESDGYTPGAIGFMHAGDFIRCGDGGEWAAIDLSRPDDNLDWFPTMREAKAHAQQHADRAARV